MPVGWQGSRWQCSSLSCAGLTSALAGPGGLGSSPWSLRDPSLSKTWAVWFPLAQTVPRAGSSSSGAVQAALTG